MEGITKLEQSQQLTALGVDKWLAERKCETCKGEGYLRLKQATEDGSNDYECPSCHGSGKAGVWPSLTYLLGCDGGTRTSFELWKDDSMVAAVASVAGMSYVHALPYMLAFEFLEDCYGWTFMWDTDDPCPWNARPPGYGMKWVHGDTESELLDKVLAAETEQASTWYGMHFQELPAGL